jgi:eukaryotic-like serine/threonine-protein kinase
MSSWVVPGFAEERELGTGASGRVVAAVAVAGGARVAIKYLSPRLLAAPGFVEAFRAEAELLRVLDVPQVVRLFGYVEAPGHGAAIIMELVDGVSLHEMITRQGPADPEPALLVLKGSLLGLAAAHALGIVHRDYKPENVLVDGSGQSKLTDFGVAARAGQAASGGTPLYMAPEQWGGGPASPATDIYAATAVFFECLTGMTPFSGKLGQLAAQHEHAAVPVELVGEPLRPLVARGMAKDPAARPANAADFVAELEATASAAYGADWEIAGRAQLAARAAGLMTLASGTAGGATAATGTGSGTATATTWLSTVKGTLAAHVFLCTGIAAAVVSIAGGAVAGITQARGHPASSTVAATSTAATSTAARSTAPRSTAVSSTTPPASPPATITPSVAAGATPAAPSPASPASPATGPCPTSGLNVAVDWAAGQVVMEHFYVPLEFTNTSGRSCTLYGYPGVAVTTGTTSASQVGSEAIRTTGGQAIRTTDVPATLITLAPGATASATLVIVNVGVYYGACNQVSVSYLEVYPPGQTSAAYVPDTGYTHQACTNPVDQLEITTIEAGSNG